jgi:hypothetical protein
VDLPIAPIGLGAGHFLRFLSQKVRDDEAVVQST